MVRLPGCRAGGWGVRAPCATLRPTHAARAGNTAKGRLGAPHASCAAVARVRPASEGLPDPLSVINYVAQSMPLLAPFIPIYKVRRRAALCKSQAAGGALVDYNAPCHTPVWSAPLQGLPGDALPAALTSGNGTHPDALSLSWKQRRLQALVFQARLAGLFLLALLADPEWPPHLRAAPKPGRAAPRAGSACAAGPRHRGHPGLGAGCGGAAAPRHGGAVY